MRKRVAIFCTCLRWQGEAAVWETKFCTFVCREIWMLASTLCEARAVLLIYSSMQRNSAVCEFLCLNSITSSYAILNDLYQWRPLKCVLHKGYLLSTDGFAHVPTQTHAHQIRNLPTHEWMSLFNVVYSNNTYFMLAYCHSSFSSAGGPDLATETVIVDDRLKWARQDVFPLLPSRFKKFGFSPKKLEKEKV